MDRWAARSVQQPPNVKCNLSLRLSPLSGGNELNLFLDTTEKAPRQHVFIKWQGRGMTPLSPRSLPYDDDDCPLATL